MRMLWHRSHPSRVDIEPMAGEGCDGMATTGVTRDAGVQPSCRMTQAAFQPAMLAIPPPRGAQASLSAPLG